MKRQTNQTGKILCLLLLFTVAAIAMVQAISIDPSAPTSITDVNNTTTAYPNGTVVNKSRGYIYNMDFTESQPTFKWNGFIGQVTGEYALIDSRGYKLYDWDIATVKGEIYATKEGPYADRSECYHYWRHDGAYTGIYNSHDARGTGSSGANCDRFAGGVPIWTNLTCVNSSIVEKETAALYHRTSFYTNASDPMPEDILNQTFKDDSFTLSTFYAGSNEIGDDDVIALGGAAGENCHGIYLNVNNTEFASSDGWQEVMLTDQTYQLNVSGGDGADQWDNRFYDILYAAPLKNDSYGYNNGTYDFQMILPMDGREGDRANIAYYFYIELV